MPRGDKSSYTDKQKRQAAHIEEAYEKRGLASDEAERRAPRRPGRRPPHASATHLIAEVEASTGTRSLTLIRLLDR